MMSGKMQVTAVDLTALPDLTVVYLGMRVTRLRGVLTLLGLGRPLRALGQDKPEGLLHQDLFFWGLNHVGIRQYWRDFDALERFTKSAPHNGWWAAFLRDPKGTGFWHETYRKSGGMEGIYLGLPQPVGFGMFAPARARQGAYARARERLAA